MSNRKTVQIDYRLFIDICDYFGVLDDDISWQGSDVLAQLITVQLRDKWDALTKRDLFSAYKSAPEGSAEREHWRQMYLDKAGVMPDCRTPSEWHEDDALALSEGTDVTATEGPVTSENDAGATPKS